MFNLEKRRVNRDTRTLCKLVKHCPVSGILQSSKGGLAPQGGHDRKVTLQPNWRKNFCLGQPGGAQTLLALAGALGEAEGSLRGHTSQQAQSC